MKLYEMDFLYLRISERDIIQAMLSRCSFDREQDKRGYILIGDRKDMGCLLELLTIRYWTVTKDD